MTSVIRSSLVICFTISLLLTLLGCGGGSSGTGTGLRRLTGTVQLTDKSAVAGATLTVAETGDSTTTGQDGSFALETTALGNEIKLLIESSSLSTSVTVNFLADGSGDVSLTITIDPLSNIAVVSGYDVRAKIEGDCDPYFENNRTIRQANRVPQGTWCPFRVSIRTAAGGLPNRVFSLEHRACSATAPWKLIQLGNTNATGSGEIQFQYFDDAEYCLYRVLVPINDPQLAPLEFDVLTFTYQGQQQ